MDLVDYVVRNKKKIEYYENLSRPVPTQITVSANRVVAEYPGYTVTYTAEGSGNERHNVQYTISNVQE